VLGSRKIENQSKMKEVLSRESKKAEDRKDGGGRREGERAPRASRILGPLG